MASSTNIYLPLWVSSERVAQVVAKVAGHPCELAAFSTQQSYRDERGRIQTRRIPTPFDPTQPAGNTNPWHVEFSGEHAQRPRLVAQEHSGLGYAQLRFHDAAQQIHEWMFFAEHEDETHKLLSPGAHGLAVAVGRRLVKFFGGHMFDCDNDDAPPSLRVSNTRATFPRRTPHQSSNERWYQFENALYAEPMLTSRELEQALDQHGANSMHRNLVQALRKLEQREKLARIAQDQLSARAAPPPARKPAKL